MHHTKKLNKKDIVTLISLKFSINAYWNWSYAEDLEFSSTTGYLFNLISEFGEVNNIKHEVKHYLADDQLQESPSDTCAMFQIYFY